MWKDGYPRPSRNPPLYPMSVWYALLRCHHQTLLLHEVLDRWQYVLSVWHARKHAAETGDKTAWHACACVRARVCPGCNPLVDIAAKKFKPNKLFIHG